MLQTFSDIERSSWENKYLDGTTGKLSPLLCPCRVEWREVEKRESSSGRGKEKISSQHKWHLQHWRLSRRWVIGKGNEANRAIWQDAMAWVCPVNLETKIMPVQLGWSEQGGGIWSYEGRLDRASHAKLNTFAFIPRAMQHHRGVCSCIIDSGMGNKLILCEGSL